MSWWWWKKPVLGMWRSSWNLVKGVPLKDCIVWTPCKAKLVQSIFNRGWEGGCFQVYVWTCLHATVQACMCTCHIWKQTSTLLRPPKRHAEIVLGTWPQRRQLVYGGWVSYTCLVLWCRRVSVRVILAPSSFLLQASSVNAQLFTVSPAHHLASLIALDLGLAR